MMKDYKGDREYDLPEKCGHDAGELAEFDIHSLYPLKMLDRPKPYVPIGVKIKFEAGDKDGIKAMRKIAKLYMNSLYGRKKTI